MSRFILTMCLLTIPSFAAAAGLEQEYAGNNLIIMAFITGFAIFALAQFGYFLMQTLSREHSESKRRKKR